MAISATAYIVLGVSVGVALLVMLGAWIWMKVKTNKIKSQYAQDNLKKTTKQNPRENYGKLLWELKNKSTHPLDDYQMELILNTAWLNKYKTFKVINFTSNYESQSLKELVNLQPTNINPDYIIINGQKEFNKLFDTHYQKLKTKQMIVIANADRKEKGVKKFINYLKVIQAKYEWQNYGVGIILVVK